MWLCNKNFHPNSKEERLKYSVWFDFIGKFQQLAKHVGYGTQKIFIPVYLKKKDAMNHHYFSSVNKK